MSPQVENLPFGHFPARKNILEKIDSFSDDKDSESDKEEIKLPKFVKKKSSEQMEPQFEESCDKLISTTNEELDYGNLKVNQPILAYTHSNFQTLKGPTTNIRPFPFAKPYGGSAK